MDQLTVAERYRCAQSLITLVRLRVLMDLRSRHGEGDTSDADRRARHALDNEILALLELCGKEALALLRLVKDRPNLFDAAVNAALDRDYGNEDQRVMVRQYVDKRGGPAALLRTCLSNTADAVRLRTAARIGDICTLLSAQVAAAAATHDLDTLFNALLAMVRAGCT